MSAGVVQGTICLVTRWLTTHCPSLDPQLSPRSSLKTPLPDEAKTGHQLSQGHTKISEGKWEFLLRQNCIAMTDFGNLDCMALVHRRGGLGSQHSSEGPPSLSSLDPWTFPVLTVLCQGADPRVLEASKPCISCAVASIFHLP